MVSIRRAGFLCEGCKVLQLEGGSELDKAGERFMVGGVIYGFAVYEVTL